MKRLTVSIAIFLAATAQANELRGVLKNNSGVRKFEGKNAAQAFDDFTGALGDLPYAGEVHFNIGNSFLIRREYEKALSEYSQAVKNAQEDSARAREVRFRALFNSAVALTELKRTDEALATYQRALELRPDSLETKTNIETLTAQGGGDGDEDKEGKDGKGKDKDKDDKDKNDKDKDKKDKPFENPKPTPRPFKSEDLSQQDVKRILEELKRQEENIRARMQNEQKKDVSPEKDW